MLNGYLANLNPDDNAQSDRYSEKEQFEFAAAVKAQQQVAAASGIEYHEDHYTGIDKAPGW